MLADLMAPLPIDEPVDAVLSTAAFHWVPDHDALFAHLGAVLRPGGRIMLRRRRVATGAQPLSPAEPDGPDGW